MYYLTQIRYSLCAICATIHGKIDVFFIWSLDRSKVIAFILMEVFLLIGRIFRY